MDQSYETYVLTSNRPPNLPNDLLVLRVRVIDIKSITATVEIIEPAEALKDLKTIRVDPRIWNSCSRWGITQSPAYVTGTFKRADDGQIIFSALQFRAPRNRPRRSTAELDEYIVKSNPEVATSRPDDR